jgi:hypothetical protein
MVYGHEMFDPRLFYHTFRVLSRFNFAAKFDKNEFSWRQTHCQNHLLIFPIFSVAEPHHFYAAPAPTLLYSRSKICKR